MKFYSGAMVGLLSVSVLGAEPPLAASGDVHAATDALAAKATRRERFELHRSVGFLSAGMQVGALVFFALDDRQRFARGASGTATYMPPEIAFGSVAELTVIVNYLLAATAPAAPGGATVRNVVHQSLTYASAIANVTRIIIAVMLAGATPGASNEGLVLAHRITAIASPVLFAGATTLQVF